MKKFTWAVLISFLFCLLTNIPTVHAKENNLQQLINQTPINGTLRLANHVYNGNIVISKSIKIIGAKHSVIKGDKTVNVVSIKAPYVELKSLTIINSGMSKNTAEEFAAIKVYTDHNVIKNIHIDHSFHGVYLSQAHDNMVENVNVVGENNGTIAGQGNGLQIYYSNHNTLKGNTVVGTRDGIFFDHSNNNKVIGNSIKKARYGLHYMYSDDNTFIQNKFTFNMGGAAIMYSNDILLKQNEFMFNNGTQSFGVLLQSSDRNTIIDNKFYENQRGLFIDQAENNIIENNQIFLNQVGIELWASSANQTFTKNHFSKNIASVLQLGGMSNNRWSKHGRGNDWGSDAVLLDLNQDHIGDSPLQNKSSLYQLVEENELAYLFLSSPSITIYEKMNEVVNHQKVMFTDPYPLLNRDHANLWIYSFVLLIPIIFFVKRRYKK